MSVPHRIWRRNATAAWFAVHQAIEHRIQRVLAMAHAHYPKFVRHRFTGNTSEGRAA